MIVILTTSVFQAMRCYSIPALRSPLSQGLRVAGSWAFVFLIVMGLNFLFRLDGLFSRVWLVSLFFGGLVVFALTRGAALILVRRLTRAGMIERRAVIVGGGKSGEQFLREVMRQPESDLRIYGVFDDREDERSPEVLAGFPKLGNVDDLVEFARSVRLDLIIFTLPISAETRILQMLRKLWVLPVDIRLASHTNQLRFRPRAYSYVGGVPVIDVSTSRSQTGRDREDDLRPHRGRNGADCAVADFPHHRDCDQTGFEGAGLLQAAPLRVQQRTRRGLQVPLDVCRHA